MRQLYVCSESTWSRYSDNYLIGIINEENGQYSFVYKFGGKFPKQYFRIQEFPDTNKTYGDKKSKEICKTPDFEKERSFYRRSSRKYRPLHRGRYFCFTY